MSHPEEPSERGAGVHLEAEATDDAIVNQAGRDLHVHFRHGVRGVRRAGRAAGPDECPYPGLAAFSYAQAEWFFGRDRPSADLVRMLSDCLADGGPLMVVAPSGAGKSSLLNAGLLPAVERGALPAAGSRHWPRIVLTPTAHPMREVAACIAALEGAFGSTTELTALNADPGHLKEVLRSGLRALAAEQATTARIVIIVDQFEELFTLCADEQERKTFIGWLWQVAREQPEGGPLALVVCGLRADFYAECANYPQLRQALQTDQIYVGPMSEDELREAILCPAEAVGLDIEAGLVEVLLRDLGTRRPGGGQVEGAVVEYDAGRLPLLGYALQATWQQRHGSTLTVDGYSATGGIQNAVATTAERVFSRLDDDAQHDARLLFLRLIKVGDNGEDTRRPVPREELLRDSRRPDVTRAVLDAYTSSRLITQTRDAVEITHEALIRAWPRLHQWIDQDRAGNLIHQDLDEAATAWDHDRTETSTLYRGSRLEAARAWASDHERDLSDMARDFLAASDQLHRRTAVLRRTAIAVLAVLALVASTASGIAIWQSSRAFNELNRAIYNQTVAEATQLGTTDTSLSAQLALAAYRMKPAQDPDLTSRLLSTENTPLATTIPSSTGSVFSVAYSPDGRTLATGNMDNAVRLWNVADPAHPRPFGPPLTGHKGHVHSVAFSPDGRIVASGSNDGTVRLWDVADPAAPRPLGQPLNGNVGIVFSVAFSPDGRTLAAGGDYGIQLWDTADPASPRQLSQPLNGGPGIVYWVAFSPDSRTLASAGDDDPVRLWDVTDPASPRQLGQPLPAGSALYSVAFSPDGRTLAVGTQLGTAQLWNVTDPRHPQIAALLPVGGNTDVARTVAFSPDSRTLAIGSTDGMVRLWNVTYPAYPTSLGQPLAGDTNIVPSVAFSPDGRTLTSGGYDGTIRFWALPRTALNSDTDHVSSVAYSEKGQMLADGADGSVIRLWNVADFAHPRALGQLSTGRMIYADSVAFSQNGRTLAAGGYNGIVQLWNVTDPAHPRQIAQLPNDGSTSINSVAFSPDGNTLANGNAIGTVRLWDVTDPGNPRALGQLETGGTEVASSLAFSPGGRILAGAGDGMIRLWNVTDPAHPQDLGEFHGEDSNTVDSVAFSPDRRTLVSGSDDGGVQLWNVADPAHLRPLGKPLTGSAGPVDSVAFSPDGRALASAGDDGTFRLWNVTDPARPRMVGQPIIVGADAIDSVAFSPDGRTLASGGSDGTIRLWNLDVNYAIKRICSTSRNDLTSQQWRKYIPQRHYDPPCA